MLPNHRATLTSRPKRASTAFNVTVFGLLATLAAALTAFLTIAR